ncbi:unnamed protein product [Symbiodinium microadriaticum]|nr:unnamed protein product [Symbiodinium microadriaticum]
MANRKAKYHKGDRVTQKLGTLLENGAETVKLLRDIGSPLADVVSDDRNTHSSCDINAHRLPLEQFGSEFMVRSITYLADKKKVKSKPAVFPLIAVDVMETSHNMRNIAALPENRVALARAAGDQSFTLIFNFMIPGPPFLSFAAYWKVDLDTM